MSYQLSMFCDKRCGASVSRDDTSLLKLEEDAIQQDWTLNCDGDFCPQHKPQKHDVTKTGN